MADFNVPTKRADSPTDVPVTDEPVTNKPIAVEPGAWDPLGPAKEETQRPLAQDKATERAQTLRSTDTKKPIAQETDVPASRRHTSARRRNAPLVTVALLLGLVGLVLLFYSPLQRVTVPVSPAQAIPAADASQQGSTHKHVVPPKPNNTQYSQSSAPSAVVITQRANYSPYGYATLLLSLCFFAFARPGAGSASRGTASFVTASSAVHWGAVALPFVLAVVGIVVFRPPPGEQAMLVYVAVMIGIYFGTLSFPAPSQGGKAQANDYIAGRVINFNSRSEGSGQSSITVWTWGVERFDERGNTLAIVPVEMRSFSISGFITNGNDIEIPATYYPGQLVSPPRVFNRTTQSWIIAARTETGRALLIFFLTPFVLLAFSMLVIYLASTLMSHATGAR